MVSVLSSTPLSGMCAEEKVVFMVVYIEKLEIDEWNMS